MVADRFASGVSKTPPRVRIAFLVALVGLVVVAWGFAASSLAWLLWLVVGIAAGLVAGSIRHVGVVVIAAAVAFFVLAGWILALTLHAELQNWLVLMLVGVTIVAAGFALGGVLASRRNGSERSARDRAIIGGAIALGFIGFLTWVGYSGLVGSNEMVQPAEREKWPHCQTPASLYHWTYAAINYDQSDDARLAAAYPGLMNCQDRLATVTNGSEVVTSDGIPIAGWYIPAAKGARDDGPTLLIAPGWKSNKSEILKYAPPFHERFNLVLIDLRNGGRSGTTLTTFGYRERLDVLAMVDWLERTKHPSWLGVVGNSMGAATVLNEAVGDDRIRALILDSMHGSVMATLGDGLEAEQHLPGYPTAWAMVGVTSLRIGADLTSIDPERNVRLLGDRPVLLIHGTNDVLDRPERSADRVFAAAKEAGVPVSLHYCEGATHGRVIDMCEQKWAGWANDFLRPLVGG